LFSASGYYEWKTINGAKQPPYFSAADGGVLSIAGLWDEWNDRTSAAGPVLSCTLIVTAANEFAGRISRPHGGFSSTTPTCCTPMARLGCIVDRTPSRSRSVHDPPTAFFQAAWTAAGEP
jgi:SOS response associated peptidase (SRAP)